MCEKPTDELRYAPSPWLRLLRAPNLLTVPGDPVAGYLLASVAVAGAGAGALLPAAGAALCLYCFGLILNDMVDVNGDAAERPERPLPSGAIPFNRARGAAIAFALTGLNLALFSSVAVLCVAAILSALIILYNAGLKKVPLFGVVAMGLCRGFSFLLGAAAAVRSPSALFSAAGLPVALGFGAVTLTFVAVSAVARREMEAEKPMGVQRYLPFAALLLALPALVVALSAQGRLVQPMATVYLFLMIMTLMRAWFLGGILYRVQPVPVTVGNHIRNHLMVQATLCAAAGAWGALPALILVLVSPLFAALSRRFYSS